MIELNILPIEVVEEVKNTLKAFDKCYVNYYGGEYHVSVGVAIKATYEPDEKVIGTYYAKEVFTPEERMLNYINEFQEYPIEYKGKRNYKDFQTGKRETFKWEDGNLVIA